MHPPQPPAQLAQPSASYQQIYGAAPPPAHPMLSYQSSAEAMRTPVPRQQLPPLQHNPYAANGGYPAP